MTQTSNRLFDEFARLMNDAAGVASGVRREVDTMVRNQAEKWLRDLDLVKREEFEAVKEMARLAREENEALKARVAALEARLPPVSARLKRLSRRPFFAAVAGGSHISCHRSHPAAISPHPAAPTPLEACRGNARGLTMANVKQMKAMARPKAGKGAARAERRAGRVPGVIYGDGKPPVTVSVDHKELKERIYAGRFLTTIYDLDVDGTTHRVIPRDFQLDAVKDLPVHVDFMRLGEGATHPRAHSGARPERRAGAGREARRHGQHRHPRDRDGGVGGRHSGIDRRRHLGTRDQPFEAPERPHAAAERAR